MNDLRISLPKPCSESWDEMHSFGCNRFCATCSETIHDLTALTSQEAEALLKTPGKHCVRALVGQDGALMLRPSKSGHQRRILVAVGASIGLLTSACETLSQTPYSMGFISGKVAPWSAKSVMAVADNGRTYRTKVFDNGSYKFKPLPYGKYSLTFTDECGNWNGGQVILQEGEHPVAEPLHTQQCVVVGMAKIEEDRG